MADNLLTTRAGHNVHPADALAELRAEIKALQIKEQFYRGILASPGADLMGEHYTALVESKPIQKLDEEKLKQALGDLKPYRTGKETIFVRVVKRR
jgi:hypothetical protein